MRVDKSLSEVWQPLTVPASTGEAQQVRDAKTLKRLIPIIFLLTATSSLLSGAFLRGGDYSGALQIVFCCLFYVIPYVAAHQHKTKAASLMMLLIALVQQWLAANYFGGFDGLFVTYFLIISTFFAASFVSVGAAILIAVLNALTTALIAPTLFNLPFAIVFQGPVIFQVLGGAFLIVMVEHWRKREQQKQELLAASEKRYRLISEHLTDFHFYYHRAESGMPLLEWVTPSYSKVTGYPIPIEKRPPPSHLYLPDDLPMVEDARRRVLAGEHVEVECRFKRPDGEVRWAIIQYFPEWDEAHTRVTGYYGALTDVTVRKREEEQRLQIAVKQEQFNLMRQFVDAMSHDFRTRLSVLENNRYLIGRAMDAPLRDRLLPRLDTMHQTIFQLNTQIDNLGAVTSLTDFRLSSTPLHEMFAGLQERYQARAQGAGLRYEQRVDMDVPVAIADTAKLETAIGHLLDNAILHGTGGTRISLLVQRWEGYVAIEVEDDGAGISEQDMQHIFAPFFKVGAARTVSEHGGIGVGLTLVKMIVEGHHGEMAIRSTEGKGTCVRLLIPRDRSGESSASLRLPTR
jgi:PAS domain S-box-containing protein